MADKDDLSATELGLQGRNGSSRISYDVVRHTRHVYGLRLLGLKLRWDMLGGVTVLVWRLEIMVQSVRNTRKVEANHPWVSYEASAQRVLDICHGRC